MKRFTVKAAAACAAMALALSSCAGTQAGTVKAGTFEAKSKGFSSEVKVSVVVGEDGKIASVAVDASGETDSIGQVAAPELAAAIVAKQGVDVDAVAGASYTSEAVLAAAAQALKAAGFGAAKEKAKGADETVEADVAIIGAGASGLMAAAAASETGAKVLVVERTGSVGGVSKHWVGGPFAVESKLQAEAGYDIKKDEVLREVVDYSHFIAYAPLVKAIVYKSGSTIEWLGQYGVTFRANPGTPQLAHQDQPMKWQLYHWYTTFGQEVAALDILAAKLQEKGVEIRFKTIATELIQDKNGVVVGYAARKADGTKLTVKAKSVVVATGGFGNNPDMMKEHFHTDKISGMGENYGDGARMAWKAGAARWDVQSALLHGAGIAAGTKPGKLDLGWGSPFNQITRSPLLWIDRSGNRFANEDAVFDTAFTSNVGYSVGGEYFIVLDAATLKDYTKGSKIAMDPAVGGPNMSPADFVALAEDGVEQGRIFKGATLAELASATGMDAARLERNVAEYNEAVASKKDPLGKQASSLVYSVKEGPFYAVKMQISNLGTLGGIRVNENLEAVDEALKPVPGLFAAGGDAAGFYGNITTYPPYEGLATGFALNSGRIAGESAAARALAK